MDGTAENVESTKRKRVRKRKQLSEEEKECRKEQKKSRRDTDDVASSSSSSTVPPEARSLVNDCTVYVEGLPFESNEDAVREFFKAIKSGSIVR